MVFGLYPVGKFKVRAMKFILRIFSTFLSRFFPGAVNGGEGGKREAITLETSLFNDPCVASDDGSTFVKLRQSGSDTHARGCISPLFVPFCIRSSPFPACYCFQVSVASTSKSENMQRTHVAAFLPPIPLKILIRQNANGETSPTITDD